MASPQTEDGYTRIANELLNELCRTSLNGTQWAVIMAVVRLTYGYGKKTAQIGISRVSQITGKHRVAVAREMSRLLKMGILVETETATFGKCRTVGINKDYEAWTLTVNESVDCERKHLHTVNESVDLPVNESVDHIKKVKKVLKKTISSIYPFEDFWESYDKKVGNRSKLEKKWESLKESDRAAIMAHIPKYKAAQPEKQYRKNPETYLNNHSWNDEIIRPPKQERAYTDL